MVAGPFERQEEDEFPIPADKTLDPAWVRSLFLRGELAEYTATKGELAYIGMPVGGICTGQVYLGGDGRLWLWDIFNLPVPMEWRDSSGPHYRTPAKPTSPMQQGFALRVDSFAGVFLRTLDASGFRDVRFRGQYPIGFVEYRDPDCPVVATLEAFSPFIPLNADDSGLPATIMSFTVKNPGTERVTVEVAGWLENPVALESRRRTAVHLQNTLFHDDGRLTLHCTAEQVPGPAATDKSPRPDIVFEDFERETYEGWTASGTAFGSGPVERRKLPAYQGDVQAQGERLVNTHNTREGEDVAGGDRHTGTLSSRPFTIERNFVSFRIGGGNHPGKTGLDLLVDGQVLRTATGRNENRMHFEDFDVRGFEGREATLRIVDAESGGWGNVGLDDIVFTDTARGDPFILQDQPDFGTMALALLGPREGRFSKPALPEGPLPDGAFFFLREESRGATVQTHIPGGQPRTGVVGRKVLLEPGERAMWTFIIAWHFTGLWWDSLTFIPDIRKHRRHYGTRFKDAGEVVRYITNHLGRLAGTTRLWHRTWYEDSTLPHWFLDRTLLNVSTLATATCLRLDDGRFYGWEGNSCCPGTCTHVWHYAQAVARLFPELERAAREKVDFGLAFHDDTGVIDYRAEADRRLAVDGQAGTILRAWREHHMTPDGAFLRRIWPRVKKAVLALIERDRDRDGLLDGPQYNTLDATWYGQIAWISSLFVAALRAGEAMARAMDDPDFAAQCQVLAERGSKALVERLFNGQWFVHRTDAAHPEANSTGTGCHIDQLLGQSWAHQVMLPRIVPAEAAVSALRSLWKYSFAPDIGPYRARFDGTIKGGRWYAMPGEGGLLMCTWPKGGMASATGKGAEAWAAGYFNECMTGFEHQVAAQMIREGLVMEGLAVTRMIHDRYHASKRNPWNEVECGDHYARAMASFGTYLAACGFEHDGPKGHLGFVPRITPDQFRCAFTAAGGWGSFEQERGPKGLSARIALWYGRLRLSTLAFELAEGTLPAGALVRLGERVIPATLAVEGRRATVTLQEVQVLQAGERLGVTIA
jgi:uncharacterized protein (DUF608 family)